MLKIYSDLEVEEGQFKVVLTTPEDEVMTLLEGSRAGVTSIELIEGVSKVKIVGYGAAGEIDLDISSSENVEVDIVASNSI